MIIIVCMTNFKSTLLLIVSVLITMMLAACTEKSTPSFLTIDIKAVNFNSIASTRDLPVKTNVENWSATVQPVAQSWMEARPVGSSLRITVRENTAFGTRKGEIKVVPTIFPKPSPWNSWGQNRLYCSLPRYLPWHPKEAISCWRLPRILNTT